MKLDVRYAWHRRQLDFPAVGPIPEAGPRAGAECQPPAVRTEPSKICVFPIRHPALGYCAVFPTGEDLPQCEIAADLAGQPASVAADRRRHATEANQLSARPRVPETCRPVP